MRRLSHLIMFLTVMEFVMTKFTKIYYFCYLLLHTVVNQDVDILKRVCICVCVCSGHCEDQICTKKGDGLRKKKTCERDWLHIAQKIIHESSCDGRYVYQDRCDGDIFSHKIFCKYNCQDYIQSTEFIIILPLSCVSLSSIESRNEQFFCHNVWVLTIKCGKEGVVEQTMLLLRKNPINIYIAK